jgi:hypothetical protein
MIPLIFKMYSAESPLSGNVNDFLRKFPIEVVSKFEKELVGVLSYIDLLQSSIEQHWLAHPLPADCTVYRGFPMDGRLCGLLYETMIGEVIVWRGFSSTSRDRDGVISTFVGSGAGVLFEISLPLGAVAVSIAEFSEFEESEILIAASTAFLVDSVDWIRVSFSPTSDSDSGSGEFEIPCVHLSYFAGWWDFDLDHCPPRFLL